MNILKEFFWLCSGSQRSLLKRCPTESNKYAGIGATIFFTGVFATISGSYALYTVFKNIPVSIAFGVVWGLMIFNLDRYIVSSMKKDGRFWREIKVATPRIILAILLAIVISKPLELKIFETEIDAELIVMEQQVFKKQEEQVKARFQADQQRLNDEILLLKNEISTLAKKRDELLLIAQQEADGTGGSKKPNLGPIYKTKKADADKADAELIALIDKNQPLIDQKQNQLQENEQTIAASIAGLERGGYNGMASRIDALGNLTSRSVPIQWASWFIMLLFIAIETAPVFVKLISEVGPYDHLLKVREHTFELYALEKTSIMNWETRKRMEKIMNEKESDTVNREAYEEKKETIKMLE